jgi:hypothetical protein
MVPWIKRIFTVPVVIGALAVFMLAAAVTLFFVLAAFPRAPLAPVRPQIVVTPPHTSTPRIPTPVPTVRPTDDLGVELPPGVLGVGAYVQIVGTGGTGLNIRADAALGDNVRFLAYDAEVFEVRDGPVPNDGFTWWYLVTPVDESRAGWAAADFLSVVDQP